MFRSKNAWSYSRRFRNLLRTTQFYTCTLFPSYITSFNNKNRRRTIIVITKGRSRCERREKKKRTKAPTNRYLLATGCRDEGETVVKSQGPSVVPTNYRISTTISLQGRCDVGVVRGKEGCFSKSFKKQLSLLIEQGQRPLSIDVAKIRRRFVCGPR